MTRERAKGPHPKATCKERQSQATRRRELENRRAKALVGSNPTPSVEKHKMVVRSEQV